MHATLGKKEAIKEVSSYGEDLAYGPVWWRHDEDIVRAAIINNPFAIRHAPIFQNNKEMGLLAISINGLARFYLSPELQEDNDILKESRQHFPRSYSAPFKRDELYYPQKCSEIKSISEINPAIKKIQLLPKSSPFIRDSHVTLFEGGHLIPYPINNPFHKELLRTMHPHYSVGKGYVEKNVAQAMITALEEGISFKLGKTCIEGGNCYLFMSKTQRKAVIGELSLYLSMIALDEQEAWERTVITSESGKEPSEEAYRIARNLALYQKIDVPKLQDEQRNQEKKQAEQILDDDSLPINPKLRELIDEDLDYHKQLVAPLSEEDLDRFRDEARKIEIKLELTKIHIANELGVPLANIVFIPQRKFHIDMELFVTPNGKIILHDDQKAIELLEDIRKTDHLCEEEKKLFQQYQIFAEKRLMVTKEIHERQKELLQRSGIDFDTLPAVFEAKEQNALNYCNGIFIENSSSPIITFLNGRRVRGTMKKKSFTYITTGSSSPHEEKLHNRFLLIFNKAFPDYIVNTIPMSNFIATTSGGIRCLTFEGRLPLEDNSESAVETS